VVPQEGEGDERGAHGLRGTARRQVNHWQGDERAKECVVPQQGRSGSVAGRAQIAWYRRKAAKSAHCALSACCRKATVSVVARVAPKNKQIAAADPLEATAELQSTEQGAAEFFLKKKQPMYVRTLFGQEWTFLHVR
jgi:hypothetical protein